MIEDVLSKIRGERISGFSFVRYPPLEPDRVMVHLESGKALQFKADEMKFGRYEAYSLNAYQESTKDRTDWVGAGWIADEIQVVKRQDWLEKADPMTETVGRNPTSHCWGPIGAAPKEASHTVIVISAVILFSRSKSEVAMIYLSDYPGLVSFTTSPKEIAAVVQAYGGPA